VATLTGDNGLLQKATTAKQENEKAKELELIKLAVSAAQVAGEGNITKDNLENELKINFNDNTITIGEIEDGWSYNSYKIDKSGKVDKLLPKEYQQVEYLESTGTQYIDTGLAISNNDNLYIKFNIPQYTDRGCIAGAGTTSTSNVIAIIMYNNGATFRIMKNERYNDLCPIPMEDIIGIEIKDRKIIVKKENTAEVHEYRYDLDAYSTPNMYLFRGNNVLNNAKCKIYNYIVYKQEKKKMELIPCKSTTTVINANGGSVPANTKGLYDTVEGKFYTNQGTGEFIAGPEV